MTKNEFNDPLANYRLGIEDLHYMGSQPMLSEKSSDNDVTHCLTWYNYFYDADAAKMLTLEFMRRSYSDARAVNKWLNVVPKYEFGQTGWFAHQLMMGGKLPPDVHKRFETRLRSLVAKGQKIAKAAPAPSQSAPNPANAIVTCILADIDEAYDQENFAFDVTELFARYTSFRVTVAVRQRVSEYYAPLLAELRAVMDGDVDLVYAYRSYTKQQIKQRHAFVAGVIDTCETAVKSSFKTSVKNDARKVRYKRSDDTYNLKSISPSSIIGARQVWLFNTVTRKLIVYNVAPDAQMLGVTGTTIRGFDADTSCAKTLRKPEETLAQFTEQGKVGLRTFMDKIKTTAQSVTGRINEDMIILRSIKA